MRLNLQKFKMVMKKRSDHKENEPIGSAIKFKRTELQMTLEEAAKDICSVSYLSKLENNIIVPSEKYIEQLKERFCIREEENAFDVEMYEDLKNRLISCLLHDRKMNKPLFKDIDLQSNYQTLLIKLGFCVLTNKQIEAYDIYKQMIPVVASMPNEEFAILVALISRMLYHETRYLEANEVLAMMPTEDIDSSLMLYRNKWVLMNAIHTENTALFHLLYPKYQQSLIHLGYYQEMNKLRVLCITYFADMMSVVSYKQFLKNNHRIPKKYLELAKIMNYLHNHHYEDVISLILKHKKPWSNDLITFYLVALDGLHRTDEINGFIKTLNYQVLNESKKLIIQFIKAKHHVDEKVVLTYIRTIIIGSQFITDDVKILRFLKYHATHILRKHFYYKEANEVSLKIERKIAILKKLDVFPIEELKSSLFFALYRR